MYKNKLSLVALVMLFLAPMLCCQEQNMKQQTESEADKAASFNKFPDALYPIRKKAKWGYMNRKGDIIIEPAYDEADDFEEGLAAVMITKEDKGLYGYIDATGNWVIEPQYTRAGKMNGGRAVVEKAELFGYVDLTGKEIIPCQFQQAGRFSEGRAAVKQNGWVGLIDEIGKMVVEPKFTCSVDHPVFVNGIAPAFGADEMTGYIDTAGQWIIQPIFHSASRFSEGLAWAMLQKDDPDAQHGFTIRGGFINPQGEYVIPPQYEFSWGFFEGYATVWKLSEDRKTKLWSVIDKEGNSILKDLTYRNMGSITDNLIPVQNEDMEWGFINMQGEEVIKPQYTGIDRFKNGLARMETGSAFNPKPIYINLKGEVVWKD